VGIATKITRRRCLDRESKFCERFANVEIAPKTATGVKSGFYRPAFKVAVHCLNLRRRYSKMHGGHAAARDAAQFSAVLANLPQLET